MPFNLINTNTTFVEAHLKSGTVTILPGRKAGPYRDSEMTDELVNDIRRETLHFERVAKKSRKQTVIEDKELTDES